MGIFSLGVDQGLHISFDDLDMTFSRRVRHMVVYDFSLSA
jgi:hypothetical protein